jgi:hypothetical protein
MQTNQGKDVFVKGRAIHGKKQGRNPTHYTIAMPVSYSSNDNQKACGPNGDSGLVLATRDRRFCEDQSEK